MNEAILEALRRDHAQLRSLLVRVDAFLRRRAAAGARLLALELAARLATHLATEPPAEGLPGGLLDRETGSPGALEALRGEHDELRSMLAALVRTVDAAAGARRDEQLAVQLRDLVDLVRIHLRKEEVLVLAASQTIVQPLRRRKGSPS